MNTGIAKVKVEILENESREHALANSGNKITKVESAEVKEIKKTEIANNFEKQKIIKKESNKLCYSFLRFQLCLLNKENLKLDS